MLKGSATVPPSGISQMIFGTNMILKVYTLAKRLLHSASKIVTHPSRDISKLHVAEHVRAVWALWIHAPGLSRSSGLKPGRKWLTVRSSSRGLQN